MVEKTPVILKNNIKKEEAEALSEAFKAIGCEIKLL